MDSWDVQPPRLRAQQPSVGAEQQLPISVRDRLPSPGSALPMHVGYGQHHHWWDYLIL